MAYSPEEKAKWIDFILDEIEKGESLRSSLDTNGCPTAATFYAWMDADEEILKRYARATEARADKIFDEILEIADKQGEDVIHTDEGEVINHNIVQRNRLQIDARKWVLAKMNPKKYGDKVDVTSGDKPLQQNIAILSLDPLKDADNDSTS